ncbi:metal-dependent hydrolase, partial [Desulfocurvibacter africanus]
MDTLRPVDHNLPAFSVRVSPRAKRAKLVCSASQGLVVVLPQGSDPSLAGRLVAHHRAWAERVLRRLGAS